MVDARGGSMRGCRHPGVRVIIPPRKCSMPTRVTCRLVKKEKLTRPPPMLEGEGLAARVLEMGPVGTKFLGPVLLEVPHFASLRGREREVVILRSDNGENWYEHPMYATEDAVTDALGTSAEELDSDEVLASKRIKRILTSDLPMYFALVSRVTRVKQESTVIGMEGGVLSSTVVPQVQAVLPKGTLTKPIPVGLQAQPIAPELVAKLLGNRVAVSPIVTIEPRRRRFHKPITLTIPLPRAAQKGMINQYGQERPTLRLLVSFAEDSKPVQWDDITDTSPMTLVDDCVSFTTTVTAKFWLIDCQNIHEASHMASLLYQEAVTVPYMAKFVVFARREAPEEGKLRIFCMTDDKDDKTLEKQEKFYEVARSRDIEVLEGRPQFVEMAGNLIPMTKSGDQLHVNFRAFRENRLPCTVKIRDQDQSPSARIAFMKEPKVARGEAPQTPICNLNFKLPDMVASDSGDLDPEKAAELRKHHEFLREQGLVVQDSVNKAEMKLSDIADTLQGDWIMLAQQLKVPNQEINQMKTDNKTVGDQAMAMLHYWVERNGDKATGNELETALRRINRDDVVRKCMRNVERVDDEVEAAHARAAMDQSGFDTFSEEVGVSIPSKEKKMMGREMSLDVQYDEQDMIKESESAGESPTGDKPHTAPHAHPEEGSQSESMVLDTDLVQAVFDERRSASSKPVTAKTPEEMSQDERQRQEACLALAAEMAEMMDQDDDDDLGVEDVGGSTVDEGHIVKASKASTAEALPALYAASDDSSTRVSVSDDVHTPPPSPTEKKEPVQGSDSDVVEAAARLASEAEGAVFESEEPVQKEPAEDVTDIMYSRADLPVAEESTSTLTLATQMENNMTVVKESSEVKQASISIVSPMSDCSNFQDEPSPIPEPSLPEGFIYDEMVYNEKPVDLSRLDELQEEEEEKEEKDNDEQNGEEESQLIECELIEDGLEEEEEKEEEEKIVLQERRQAEDDFIEDGLEEEEEQYIEEDGDEEGEEEDEEIVLEESKVEIELVETNLEEDEEIPAEQESLEKLKEEEEEDKIVFEESRQVENKFSEDGLEDEEEQYIEEDKEEEEEFVGEESKPPVEIRLIETNLEQDEEIPAETCDKQEEQIILVESELIEQVLEEESSNAEIAPEIYVQEDVEEEEKVTVGEENRLVACELIEDDLVKEEAEAEDLIVVEQSKTVENESEIIEDGLKEETFVEGKPTELYVGLQQEDIVEEVSKPESNLEGDEEEIPAEMCVQEEEERIVDEENRSVESEMIEDILEEHEQKGEEVLEEEDEEEENIVEHRPIASELTEDGDEEVEYNEESAEEESYVHREEAIAVEESTPIESESIEDNQVEENEEKEEEKGEEIESELNEDVYEERSAEPSFEQVEETKLVESQFIEDGLEKEILEEHEEEEEEVEEKEYFEEERQIYSELNEDANEEKEFDEEIAAEPYVQEKEEIVEDENDQVESEFVEGDLEKENFNEETSAAPCVEQQQEEERVEKESIPVESELIEDIVEKEVEEEEEKDTEGEIVEEHSVQVENEFIEHVLEDNLISAEPYAEQNEEIVQEGKPTEIKFIEDDLEKEDEDLEEDEEEEEETCVQEEEEIVVEERKTVESFLTEDRFEEIIVIKVSGPTESESELNEDVLEEENIIEEVAAKPTIEQEEQEEEMVVEVEETKPVESEINEDFLEDENFVEEIPAESSYEEQEEHETKQVESEIDEIDSRPNESKLIEEELEGEEEIVVKESRPVEHEFIADGSEDREEEEEENEIIVEEARPVESELIENVLEEENLNEEIPSESKPDVEVEEQAKENKIMETPMEEESATNDMIEVEDITCSDSDGFLTAEQSLNDSSAKVLEDESLTNVVDDSVLFSQSQEMNRIDDEKETNLSQVEVEEDGECLVEDEKTPSDIHDHEHELENEIDRKEETMPVQTFAGISRESTPEWSTQEEQLEADSKLEHEKYEQNDESLNDEVANDNVSSVDRKEETLSFQPPTISRDQTPDTDLYDYKEEKDDEEDNNDEDDEEEEEVDEEEDKEEENENEQDKDIIYAGQDESTTSKLQQNENISESDFFATSLNDQLLAMSSSGEHTSLDRKEERVSVVTPTISREPTPDRAFQAQLAPVITSTSITSGPGENQQQEQPTEPAGLVAMDMQSAEKMEDVAESTEVDHTALKSQPQQQATTTSQPQQLPPTVKRKDGSILKRQPSGIEGFDLIEEEGPVKEETSVDEDFEEVLDDGTVRKITRTRKRSCRKVLRSLKSIDGDDEVVVDEYVEEIPGSKKENVVESFKEPSRCVSQIDEVEQELPDGSTVKRNVTMNRMVSRVRTHETSFDESGAAVQQEVFEIDEVVPGTESAFVDGSDTSSSNDEEGDGSSYEEEDNNNENDEEDDDQDHDHDEEMNSDSYDNDRDDNEDEEIEGEDNENDEKKLQEEFVDDNDNADYDDVDEEIGVDHENDDEKHQEEFIDDEDDNADYEDDVDDERQNGNDFDHEATPTPDNEEDEDDDLSMHQRSEEHSSSGMVLEHELQFQSQLQDPEQDQDQEVPPSVETSFGYEGDTSNEEIGNVSILSAESDTSDFVAQASASPSHSHPRGPQASSSKVKGDEVDSGAQGGEDDVHTHRLMLKKEVHKKTVVGRDGNEHTTIEEDSQIQHDAETPEILRDSMQHIIDQFMTSDPTPPHLEMGDSEKAEHLEHDV